jgi:hypothetical protein
MTLQSLLGVRPSVLHSKHLRYVANVVSTTFVPRGWSPAAGVAAYEGCLQI